MRERVGRSSSLPSLSSPIANDRLLHVSVVSRRKSNNPGARESRDELGAVPDGVVRNGITRSAGGINRTVGSGGRRAQLEGGDIGRAKEEVCKLFLHLHHTVRVGNRVSENRANISTALLELLMQWRRRRKARQSSTCKCRGGETNTDPHKFRYER